MLTLHAAGGAAMIAAARQAAEEAGPARPLLLAVTVLTSLSPAALAATGVADPPAAQVVRLARLALAAGADGLVCSPFEIAPIRDALGDHPALVVPGVRPAGAEQGDQARVATPEEAVAWGADWIVLGRPITRAADPARRRPRRGGRPAAVTAAAHLLRFGSRIVVKICGLRDAARAGGGGGGEGRCARLSFFAASPRRSPRPRRRRWPPAPAGRALRVGLFVDAAEEAIAATLARCPLDALQLHGAEPRRGWRRCGRASACQ